MSRSARRIYPRPYWFEILAVANLLIIHLMLAPASSNVLTSILVTLGTFGLPFAAYAVIGVAIRSLVAWRRGTLRRYLRLIRTAGWISDTVRIALFSAVMIHAYCWIKLLVPLMHPRLFDRQLWELDQALLFGLSPNILAIELFSPDWFLRFIDWSYARVFFTSMALAFLFFLSSPSRRLRVAFAGGNTAMWLIAAWIYMFIPSLGPAFRFPEIWAPLTAQMPTVEYFQVSLMRNYRNVLRLTSGTAGEIQLMWGIGALPSMHVGFQTYAFLWMRHLWVYGQIVFGVFAFVILIGSLVTGWHYLVDGLAGMLIAWVCYALSVRSWRVLRYLRLDAAARRAQNVAT